MNDKEKMEKIINGISENENSHGNMSLTLKDKLSYGAKMFKDTTVGKYKNFSKLKFLLSVLAMIYVISPFDFIPDAILGLGQLDDVTIFLGAWKIIEKDISNYKVWKDKIERKNINDDGEINK